MFTSARTGEYRTTGDPSPPYAHSRNDIGVRQGLREHLDAVGELAAANAEPLGAWELGRAAAHWHDLGKYHPEFQRYLLEAEAGLRARGTGPNHKAAGACLAGELCQPLAFVTAGHHGGLMDRSELVTHLGEWASEETAEALRLAPTDLRDRPGSLQLPSWLTSAREAEFFIRMLFSALVDADYLDTENHFTPDRGEARGTSYPLAELWRRFDASHARLPAPDGTVGQVRAEVYSACLRAAEQSPGIFRLTVPTGGGKTLSAMGFALRHALQHGMHRIVMAVPFTTITEQTAGVYREAFEVEHAVLEHHSAIDPALADVQTQEGLWGRLASETWDAPVIVTTTVQLFESLFARSTSKCRKLHRLARSVIILDEAQSLPSSLLTPILDVLQELAGHYGTSIVLCTATQPALDDAPGFAGLRDVREIVPDASELFSRLRRVRYELALGDDPWTWQRVAGEMHEESQALAIANTISDAQTLFAALDDPDAFHLSTRLCGAHRWRVLEEIRRRLHAGEPCRVASTQVVEAGVDVDFPLVLRALGPLDRIVQAAGRCNREGRRPVGRVVVFEAADGTVPPGTYRTATARTRQALGAADVDLHDPALYHRYFRSLFGDLNLDEPNIQALRHELCYRRVAEGFRMIPDDTVPVVVRYEEGVDRLLARARVATRLTRELMRALQPHMVAIRRRDLERHRGRGLVQEVREGLWEWTGVYDERLGLVAENDLLIA